MPQSLLGRAVAGAAAVMVVGIMVAAVLLSSAGGKDPAPAASSSSSTSSTTSISTSSTRSVAPPGPPDDVRITMAPDAGRAIPSGFLGFSFEFPAVRAYTGTDPTHVNPVLVQLLRNLTPGQSPVLRIGGDSTDTSYVAAAGVRPPSYVNYRLSAGWMQTTAALARRLHARLIMGLNLAADDPRLDIAEARADIAAFGGSLSGFEIGNEPNVYGKITALRTVLGVPVTIRPRGFSYAQFRRQYDAIARRLPARPLAGPALAVGPNPGPGSWVHTMPAFLRHERRLTTMTVHRYPLRNCNVPPRSPQYPSIAHLLAPYATRRLAASLNRWLAIANDAHRSLRVDELNSVACRGKSGVSDTFASALWVTDALFALANAGVDGIDMHTLPDSAYELFSFSDRGGRWSASVPPIYYGLQLFAQAAPPGSRLVSLARSGATSALSSWATRSGDGTIRVVLINKSTRRSDRVSLVVPPGSRTISVERMTAPAVSARAGVSLGRRSYGPATTTGRLAAPIRTPLTAAGASVKVNVPAASAALVQIGG